jgi:hypothetical protein
MKQSFVKTDGSYTTLYWLITIFWLICLVFTIYNKTRNSESFCIDKNWIFFENNRDLIYDYVKPFSQREHELSLPDRKNNNVHYAYMDCSNNCQDRAYPCSPHR